jgi:uncharacterized protein YceH (UPF0502 family)
MSDADIEQPFPPIKSLTRSQRRVLGVLIEKGLTTPDQYPLTLKATTSGCNQKNNRDPVTNYSEDDVADALGELRELGLATEVHTEGGRTERYRHQVRRRMTITEPQLAILGELLLRGPQAIGELRSRASRMVDIPTLPQLRTEFAGLMSIGAVRANDELERRGVIVDHNWYEDRERQALPARSASDDGDDGPAVPPVRSPVANPMSAPSVHTSSSLSAVASLESRVASLQSEVRELREQIDDLRAVVDRLRSSLGD